mmetsp:Transcript_74493/g.218369  ORF Transcript_74493/g.218369 Transcript_74493/m.218369 type:complete len:224 (+) Transcript_74493:936-1607(+)
MAKANEQGIRVRLKSNDVGNGGNRIHVLLKLPKERFRPHLLWPDLRRDLLDKLDEEGRHPGILLGDARTVWAPLHGAQLRAKFPNLLQPRKGTHPLHHCKVVLVAVFQTPVLALLAGRQDLVRAKLGLALLRPVHCVVDHARLRALAVEVCEVELRDREGYVRRDEPVEVDLTAGDISEHVHPLLAEALLLVLLQWMRLLHEEGCVQLLIRFLILDHKQGLGS